MNTKNLKKAKIILAVYLIATLALLFMGYSVRKPKVAQREFPFTITYSYQGETKTISDVYVGEYVPTAKYLGDDSVTWYGYIKDHNRLEPDFYRIAIVAFPFIFIVSVLSEIVADTSVWQQILYFTPALTVLGIAASVAMRRCGYGKRSLFIQFLGPILFAINLLIVPL